jgi:hypothetical protein
VTTPPVSPTATRTSAPAENRIYLPIVPR